MRAFMYGLTALVTGLHNFYWLMSAVYGAPISPLNWTGLLGSALLMLTAVILLIHDGHAAKLGVAGAALSWVFYGPFLAVRFAMPSSAWHELGSDVHFHELVPVVGTVFGPILLAITTVDSILALKRQRSVRRASLK